VESPLAALAEQALLDRVRSLSPEERLDAFLMHSQLMIGLYQAGEKVRRQTSPSNPSS